MLGDEVKSMATNMHAFGAPLKTLYVIFQSTNRPKDNWFQTSHDNSDNIDRIF